MESNEFKYLGLSSLLFAVFTTFCLYQNFTGITMPFFLIGTLFYFHYCMKKFHIAVKKRSRFYSICVILIGISTFLTDDYRIIFLNYIVCIILLLTFMIHNFYEDEDWGIDTYLLSMASMAVKTLLNIGRPFKDFKEYRNTNKNGKASQVKNIIIGICVSIPLLMIVLLLLSSADVVFGQMFTRLFSSSMSFDIIAIFYMIVIVFLVSYAFISKIAKKDSLTSQKEYTKSDSVIAITFVSLLFIVYFIFSFIQIFYLFLGNLRLPVGYTYAQYAREGFFQLLLVCIINLILVLVCLYRFKVSKVLNALLMGITVCTFIMIASSAMRMLLYIRIYGLTFLRILVLWALITIFLLILGVLFAIKNKEFKLFRYEFMVITILFIFLSYSHPDYIIASYNLKNTPSKLDTQYLADLSSDAALAIAEYQLDDRWSADYFDEIGEEYKIGIRNFNVSRFVANEIAKK